MKVLVCGSRDFPNPFSVALQIDRRIAALPPGSEVIHGAARGADTIAALAAKRHGHDVTPYRADWKKLGKRAGFIRNNEMLDAKPDLVIAFWDGKSRGTAHTIDSARQRGIPVEVLIEVPA